MRSFCIGKIKRWDSAFDCKSLQRKKYFCTNTWSKIIVFLKPQNSIFEMMVLVGDARFLFEKKKKKKKHPKCPILLFLPTGLPGSLLWINKTFIYFFLNICIHNHFGLSRYLLRFEFKQYLMDLILFVRPMMTWNLRSIFVELCLNSSAKPSLTVLWYYRKLMINIDF